MCPLPQSNKKKGGKFLEISRYVAKFLGSAFLFSTPPGPLVFESLPENSGKSLAFILDTLTCLAKEEVKKKKKNWT